MTLRRLATPVLALATVALALRSERVREWLGDVLISTGMHLVCGPEDADMDPDASERIRRSVEEKAAARDAERLLRAIGNNGRGSH